MPCPLPSKWRMRRSERVTVNIAGTHILSHSVNIELPLHGREINETDLSRIHAQSQNLRGPRRLSRASSGTYPYKTLFITRWTGKKASATRWA